MKQKRRLTNGRGVKPNHDEAKSHAGLRRYWSDVRVDYQKVRAAQQCVLLHIRRRVWLIAPYREECIPTWEGLDGRWRHKSTVWSFPIQREKDLRAILPAIFGPNWEWKG